MSVRFKTIDGAKVAIMPLADYKALRAKLNEAEENAGTARIVERGMRAVDDGAEVLIPMEVVSRIGKGENKLRAIREWRGVTQMALSAKIAIGQGYLSDLENGRREGTVEVWRRIADALKVPLDLLV